MDTVQVKVCTGCRQEKPLDAFAESLWSAGGRARRCKACRPQDNATAKVCNKCKIEKPLDEFHVKPGVLNGRQSRCKACRCRDKDLTAADFDSLPGEEWRPCVKLDGLEFEGYAVSNFGRVKRTKAGNATQAGRILKLMPMPRSGYLRVRMSINGGKPIDGLVHKLVAAAFLGPRPEGMWVLHKDDDKTNNRPDNIEYGTPKRNAEQARLNGKLNPCKGSDHCHAVLDEEKVGEVKKLIAAGGMTRKEIGERYGVIRQTIDLIANGKTWKHVT